MSKTPKFNFKTAKHIFEAEYPPPSFLVPNLIPSCGLTILAGPFKGCKSWFLLYLCMILSTSGKFLDYMFLEKRKGIYLALEDSEARFHHRMHCLGFIPGDECLISTSFPSGKEGLDCLRKILAEDRTIQYVIIDTLGKFSTGRGKGGFQEDYDWIGSIKDVADSFHLAIVMVHHLRKMGDEVDIFNEISGSCGSMAAADSILVLKKQRNSGSGTLSCTGRDFEDMKYQVYFSSETYRWSIKGEHEESASTPERQEVLDILKRQGEMTPLQIAGQISRTSKSVSNILSKLKREGFVANGAKYGSWVSTESFTSSTSSGVSACTPADDENVLLVM